jgi:hypothetical protein
MIISLFQFFWPALDEEKSDIRQTKAIYNFKYLPAGLFNRAQVFLHLSYTFRGRRGLGRDRDHVVVGSFDQLIPYKASYSISKKGSVISLFFCVIKGIFRYQSDH